MERFKSKQPITNLQSWSFANLKTAWKAFWSILLDKPHVYSDNDCSSLVGSAECVENHLEFLVAQYNSVAEQENVLNEAKKIIE